MIKRMIIGMVDGHVITLKPGEQAVRSGLLVKNTGDAIQIKDFTSNGGMTYEDPSMRLVCDWYVGARGPNGPREISLDLV